MVGAALEGALMKLAETLAILLAASSLTMSQAADKPDAEKLNVLFIAIDDLRPEPPAPDQP